MADFIECTSLTISYDIMGVVTISYIIISDTSSPGITTGFNVGGRVYNGYVTTVSLGAIPNTKWYETHVTLIATAN